MANSKGSRYSQLIRSVKRVDQNRRISSCVTTRCTSDTSWGGSAPSMPVWALLPLMGRRALDLKDPSTLLMVTHEKWDREWITLDTDLRHRNRKFKHLQAVLVLPWAVKKWTSPHGSRRHYLDDTEWTLIHQTGMWCMVFSIQRVAYSIECIAYCAQYIGYSV